MVDANGWPTEDFQVIFQSGALGVAHDYNGVYKLSFTGHADDVVGINDLLVDLKDKKGLDVPLHIDGASGAELLTVLLDLTPAGRELPPVEPWKPEKAPRWAELAAKAAAKAAWPVCGPTCGCNAMRAGTTASVNTLAAPSLDREAMASRYRANRRRTAGPFAIIPPEAYGDAPIPLRPHAADVIDLPFRTGRQIVDVPRLDWQRHDPVRNPLPVDHDRRLLALLLLGVRALLVFGG